MNKTAIIATVIVIVSAGVGFLNGCNAIRDGVAKLIGAPTTTQIAAEEDRLKLAEDKLVELEDRKIEAEAEAAEASRLEQLELQRTDQIKSIYGEMAQRYTELEGPAQETMMRAMDDVRQQLDESGKAAKRARALVASYVADAKRLEGEVTANNRVIDDAYANLQGFEDATAAAIANVGGFVRTASESAGLLGVPGAAAASKIGGQVVEGALTSLLVGGTGLAAWQQRRRRRREETGRKQAEAETDDLTRIIHAVKKFKLLTTDRTLLDGAKEWAGAEAHDTLKAKLAKPGVIGAVTT